MVEFAGRDGRQRHYDFADLPVPGMRAGLAAAFAARVGYTGTLNTLASANNAWQSLRRFTAFLAQLPGRRPAAVGEITVAHLRRFRLDRLATMSEIAVMAEMRRVCRVLMEVPADQVRPDTHAWLTTGQFPVNRTTPTGAPGYSDEVFGQIVRAARSDVAAIRDRIQTGNASWLRYPRTRLSRTRPSTRAGCPPSSAAKRLSWQSWPRPGRSRVSGSRPGRRTRGPAWTTPAGCSW